MSRVRPSHTLLYTRVAPALLLVALAVLSMAPVAPAAAQDYELLGSVETRAYGAYRKDSPVVADPAQRGTWALSALTRLEATHRLTLGSRGEAELLLDHALTLVPLTAGTQAPSSFVSTGSTVGGVSTGTGGTGAAGTTGVQPLHEVYQAWLGLYPADWLSLRLGRQRLNWGTGWTFSATDALHPRSPDSEVEPGFDGASLSLIGGANLAVEGALAAQDAFTTTDPEDLRTALYLNAFLPPVDACGAVVHQYATMLRPGLGLSLPAGPFLLAGELAAELYDPRGEVLNTQTLASLGAEYSRYGERADLTLLAEYLHNGLEETFPGPAATDLVVTTDAADGFRRPGRHYAAATAALAVSESWSTEHSVLANLSDESLLISHSATMLRIPGLDLSARVIWNVGEVESEFGLLEQGMVVELGLQAHF